MQPTEYRLCKGRSKYGVFYFVWGFGEGGNLRTLVSNDRNLSPNGLVIKGNVLVHVIEMPGVILCLGLQ